MVQTTCPILARSLSMVQTTDKAALRVLKDSYGPDHATLRDKAALGQPLKGKGSLCDKDSYGPDHATLRDKAALWAKESYGQGHRR